jgi:hypothetical protein
MLIGRPLVEIGTPARACGPSTRVSRLREPMTTSEQEHGMYVDVIGRTAHVSDARSVRISTREADGVAFSVVRLFALVHPLVSRSRRGLMTRLAVGGASLHQSTRDPHPPRGSRCACKGARLDCAGAR